MGARTEATRTATGQDYWQESARPLASLAFVAPMLLIYEVGCLVLGRNAARNGADVWLRQLLDLLGFSQYFLLPAVTCGLLLGWHHLTRRPWRLRYSVLYGMLLESVAFGFLLMLLAGWQRALFAPQPTVCAVAASRAREITGLLVGYLGAGIYEELLFRLVLLSAAIGGLRLCRVPPRWSAVAAAVMTSALFAAAHCQIDLTIGGHRFATAAADVFTWYSFTFRFLAGCYFSGLFLYRGFGVAAGAHAAYDIFTLL
jgi:membrane protease YdiL (CAAX protease family)